MLSRIWYLVATSLQNETFKVIAIQINFNFNEYYVEKQQPEIVDLLSDLVIESFLNENIASMPLHKVIEGQVKDSVNAWIKRMCDLFLSVNWFIYELYYIIFKENLK